MNFRVLSSEVSMAISYVGTPYYMSPEQVAKMRYNESSDVWSLGCLIYELCALHPPFTAKDQKELYGKIKKGEFRRIPHAYSEELFTTLSSMLKQNPEKRPSVESLLRKSKCLLKLIQIGFRNAVHKSNFDDAQAKTFHDAKSVTC